MCGFVGFTYQNIDAKKVIKEMSDSIKHRGPDAYGYHIEESIAFGFRRLSIIDLSDRGNQPFVSDDGSVILVFNGEIYNYKALRETLIQAGMTFKSETDSEVILRGYQAYGMDIVKHLRGMFAFAIFDKDEEALYIARDHFGIKPVYYTNETKDGSLLFGSEIKSFLKHPNFVKTFNRQALKPYLMFQYSAMDESFFKGVYRLKPGHYLSYKDKRAKEVKYEEMVFNNQHEPWSQKQIHRVMSESVALHKQSDVPVGAFLSGGVDSSYLVSLLKPDKTFSVGFAGYEAIFDETNLAADLSNDLGITHYKKLISPDEFFEAVPKIQYHMDQPHANLSSVPLYFLSEMAKKHVTVVLSGEGADELFAGYDWYYQSPYLKSYLKLPQGIRKSISKLAKYIPIRRLSTFLEKGQDVEKTFIGQAKVFPAKELKTLLKSDYQEGPCARAITKGIYKKDKHYMDLIKMQNLDMKQWLPGDILQKADKMSMAHSLELRVPYLDKEVFKLARSIPVKDRFRGKTSKYPLRLAADKSLPLSWSRRKKVGFPVPIRHWLRDEKYYQEVKEVLTSKRAELFFNTSKLQTYLLDHYENRHNYARYIWTVYVFLVWHKEYFDEI